MREKKKRKILKYAWNKSKETGSCLRGREMRDKQQETNEEGRAA
jgi:hypothetical protein